MADDSLKKRITYDYPMFEDYIQPKGTLNRDPACHACFYYGMLAHKARLLAGENLESQVILYKVGETPPEWMVPRDVEIARSVALIYALESPEDFLKYKREAWAQAKIIGVEIPPEVFLVSPGKEVKH